MKKQCKIFMLGLLVALVSTGMLWAQERAEDRELRGSFVRIAERIEKTRATIVELRRAAEDAEREGQRDRAAELREEAERLAEQLEAHVRQVEGRRPVRPEERTERLRQMAREAEQRGEMDKARQLWAEAQELERGLRRDLARREMAERRPEEVHRGEPSGRIRPERPQGIKERPEPERRRPGPMEPERRREPVRERPEPPRPWAHLERMEKELKEVLAVNLERMVNEFRELQMHVERLERELQDLRAENARLRSQLQGRDRPRDERPRDVRQQREPREPEQRREQPEAREREEGRQRAEARERQETRDRPEARGREEGWQRAEPRERE